ncbi:MAG: TIGR03790 family protein [Phycisphaerales bacterium]|nr:TIGR03790 family protein [Phycisphaerales bacterium]
MGQGNPRAANSARLLVTVILGLAAVFLSAVAPSVRAGGGPQNVVLIVDPRSAAAMYVANYYKAARGIPDANILYMPPVAADYASFVAFQIDALHGTLGNRGIADHVDYVVVPAGADYYLDAVNLVFDPCVAIRRFSTSAVYTLSFNAVQPGEQVTRRNEYYSSSGYAMAFRSATEWFLGSPSSSPFARRYFIGAMLGYDGNRGNSVGEILTMIDRSVSADGTRPAGTFYYMHTNDEFRSGPRHTHFPAAIDALTAMGQFAVEQNAILPAGAHDCLGIMTGAASPDVAGTDLTIRPGAFCDHLTSYAADFDRASQTKVSAWIANGASGSWGSVEEPCNYPQKFPRPMMHVCYARGMSLGEAVFRSIEYAPFQMLLYGDPLTQPFAHVPDVTVVDAPSEPVNGAVRITPAGTTGKPGAVVGRFDLFVDGRWHSTVSPGQTFLIDTRAFADGPHEALVVAYDDSPIATQGRWRETMDVDNHGRWASVAVNPSTGDLNTIYQVLTTAGSGPVAETRLLHNGRVIAATTADADTFPVPASIIGAGKTRLIAETEFTDGTRARSAAIVVETAFTPSVLAATGGGNSPPIAYGYTAEVSIDGPTLLDLPATDVDGDPLIRRIVTPPAQATVQERDGVFLLRPNLNATGTDTLFFEADDGQSSSDVAEVTIRYGASICLPPMFVDEPASADVCEGDAVSLRVTVVGTPPFGFQWRRNGQDIAGADGDSLFIASASPDDSGTYDCVVSNGCGTPMTVPVELTVYPRPLPQITSQPGPMICPGESVTLDAGAWSSYAWSTGAATRAIVVNQTGAYSVTVTNDFGCAGATDIDVFVGAPRVELAVQLEGVVHPVTRLVTLVVSDCSGNADQRVVPLTVGADGVGHLSLVNVSPAAEWISAREGHTLKRAMPLDFDECGRSVVDMTGAHRLIAGDLHGFIDQDNVIDMLDFAALAAGWGRSTDPHQSSGGDINGDGVQATADFTAILVNAYLSGDADEYCNAARVRPREERDMAMQHKHAKMRINVAELHFPDARRADTNDDGLVDMAEIVGFLQRSRGDSPR